MYNNAKEVLRPFLYDTFPEHIIYYYLISPRGGYYPKEEKTNEKRKHIYAFVEHTAFIAYGIFYDTCGIGFCRSSGCT